MAVGGGGHAGAVSADVLGDLSGALAAGDDYLRESAAAGRDGVGWINLPAKDISEVEETGKWISGFGAMVQAGIGGSALGNLMLHGALLPPYWNELPRSKREGPRFYMADNVDPADNRMIWNLIDPADTVFTVISKSGSTAETMANFLFSGTA